MQRRTFVTRATATGASLLVPTQALAQRQADTATPAENRETPQSGYAPVNGLELYYEIHGSGAPMVLLHGAFGAVPMWGAILDGLAAERQVIAVELQGHGRTADSDRPFSYEQFADDIAAVLDHLGIAQADVAGHSMGANTALQVAIRHPDRVRSLVLLSANYRYDGEYPEVLDGVAALTPDMLSGTPVEALYQSLAPDPAAFPVLVEKLRTFLSTDFAFPEEDLRAIAAPAFLAYGDSDTVRLGHAVSLFQLLGGGVPGDFFGLPDDQLVILPATTHESIIAEQPDRLVAMITSFLEASATKA